MTTATTAAQKARPAQCDVRIVGGKTTVQLRAYGLRSMERMTALLSELDQNATTAKEIHDANVEVAVAIAKLIALLRAEQ
jgi:hypothetical protein